LGLQPREFWRLTPRQFFSMALASQRQFHRETIMAAWWIGSLVGCLFTDKGLPPVQKLLKALEPGFDPAEDARQEYDKAKGDFEHIVSELSDDALKKGKTDG